MWEYRSVVAPHPRPVPKIIETEESAMAAQRPIIRGSLPTRASLRPAAPRSYLSGVHWAPSYPAEPATFLDTFCDVFTPPDGLEATAGMAILMHGPLHDALQIRRYFEKAIAEVEAETADHGE